MRWILGENKRHLRSECGRFYIYKTGPEESLAYSLADGDAPICTERGEGAKGRCMARAEEIAGEAK